nr:ORF3 [Bearded dragon adenovirus 1]
MIKLVCVVCWVSREFAMRDRALPCAVCLGLLLTFSLSLSVLLLSLLREREGACNVPDRRPCPPPCECPENWLYFKRECYFEHPVQLNKSECERQCRSINSTIVEVENIDFVKRWTDDFHVDLYAVGNEAYYKNGTRYGGKYPVSGKNSPCYTFTENNDEAMLMNYRCNIGSRCVCRRPVCA